MGRAAAAMVRRAAGKAEEGTAAAMAVPAAVMAVEVKVEVMAAVARRRRA